MQFLRNLAKAITPRSTTADQGAMSDEALAALIDEAKGERAAGSRTSVFDLGPEPSPARPVPEPLQQAWVNPAYDRGITPSRPFGRR